LIFKLTKNSAKIGGGLLFSRQSVYLSFAFTLVAIAAKSSSEVGM
jgi:hypothetical protein